jgi:IPT/TIG domain-containing protein
VSANLNPPTILPGQSSTIVFSAGSGAPISRNISITVNGTPKAPVASASITFLLDVTQPPGSLLNNQTSYLSLEGDPNSAVYDPLHKLIFASNPSWNRVDVISATTRKLIRSVPVPDSRSVDITQDRSRVWVGTGGHQVYEINTTTFSAIRHPLPDVVVSGIHAPWEDFQVLALADGTVMLEVIPQGIGIPTAMVWDPVSLAVTNLSNPVPGGFGLMQRTGDGKRVYCFPADSGGMALFYDVIAKTFSTPVNIGGQPFTGAVNFDGSRVLAGLAMFDGNFNFLGNVPGGGVLGGPAFDGGTVFSDDTGILYEVSMPGFTPLILAIDPNTLNLISTAPALPMIPAGTELSPSFFVGIPFAVDSSGMVLERQDYGIAFDDSTFTVAFSPLTPGTPTFLQHMTPQVGPLAGGTPSGGFGNAFSLTPDVWYGANRGTASISNAGTLSITSPPGAPGPVDVKFIFPNGIEVYDPLFFSYGPFVQYSIQSGVAPTGGSTGQIGGYGLPANSSGGSITVAGSAATITGSSPRIGSLTFGGYPFPAGTVNFTVPAGSPGFANVTVNTPAGSSTFPKGIFYAQSVIDFASADSFSAILYDGGRQQLYLSAGDHIDVFSVSAGHFVTPFTPPAQGGQKRFAGMALSPDGSTLFAADLNDGSLAVIDPDNPAASSFIPVAPVDTGDPRCTRGPLYVASAINNHVYVVTGGLPAIGCGPGGNLFQVDTVAKTSTAFNDVKCGPNPLSGSFVSSSHAGTKIAFSNCIYDENTAIVSGFRFNFLNQQAIAGDGNVAAGLSTFAHSAFSDMTGNIISRVALADPYYGSVIGGAFSVAPRQEPRLNESGSLFFQPWPQFFDIIDVQHGTLVMRFSLAQTILDVGAPMAVDSGGRHVYLISDRGLTIVDLGSAVLSVGSLSPAAGAPGTLITVRGSGFDPSTTATLGGQAATVTFVDENTLTLTVPALTSGPTDLLLTKSGGLSYRLENAVNIP